MSTYQVVDSLSHLVNKQRRRFRIGGLDPSREKTSLVSLEEQELIQVGIGDLFHGLDIIARNKLIVSVAEEKINEKC